MLDQPNGAVPIANIEHGKNPRVVTDEAKQAELAESIKQHGVLQPIRVRRTGAETYTVIAGHRRLEAARTAGLEKVPVFVAEEELPEDDVYVQSLVENLQREDLDPIDEATAYQALLKSTGWTQAQLGKKVGKGQPEISNSLSLLKLPDVVRQEISAGKISVGHAKVIAAMPKERQEQVAKDVVERNMSVREVESVAYQDRSMAQAKTERSKRVKASAQAIKDALSEMPPGLLIENDTEVANLLAADGIEVRPVNWQTDVTGKRDWSCSCKAYLYAGALEGFRKVCVEPKHAAAQKKKEESAQRKAEAEVDEVMATSKTMIAEAVRTTPDGQRIALFVLIRDESYMSRRAVSFLRQLGVQEVTASTPDDRLADALWSQILEMTDDQVAASYGDVVAERALGNPFTMPPYSLRTSAFIRLWMANRLGLDERVVWGGNEPSGSDLPPLGGKPIDPTPTEPTPDPDPTPTEPEIEGRPDAIDEANADAAESMMEAFEKEVGAVPDDPSIEDERSVEATFLDQEVTASAGGLEGEVVVVTGVVQGMDRNQVMAAVVNAGGQWQEVVTKATTLLVTGDRPGAAKVRKAEELGTKTISEEQFRERLGGS